MIRFYFNNKTSLLSLQIVISGARDYTVKVFDFTKSSAKRSTRSIKEVESVRVVEMHPTGTEFLWSCQTR